MATNATLGESFVDIGDTREAYAVLQADSIRM